MAGPVFQSAGTTLAITSGQTSAAVPVPSGVTGTTDEQIIVVIYKENTNTVTPPAGFTEAPDSPIVVTGTQPHNTHIFWKRPTAADAGTYNFTWSGTTFRGAIALRFTGCVTSGNPFDVTASAIKTTTTDGTTPAVSDTTTRTDTLALLVMSAFNDGACSTASGFTEIFDPAGGLGLAIDVKAQAAAGATGSLSATFAANGSTGAWLGALIPAAAGAGMMPFFSLYAGMTGSDADEPAPLQPPTAPTCISAIAGAVTNSVVLNWDDAVFAAGSTNQQYEVHEDLFSADNIVATVTDSTRTSGALTSGNYRYYVVAVDNNGRSAISPKLAVTVPVTSAVDAPSGCSGIGGGGGTPTAPIFVGDYSTGNFQQWVAMNTPQWNQTSGGDKDTTGYPSTGNYSAQIVTDPVKGNAARFELRGVGETQPFPARTEVKSTVAQTGNGHEGDIRWYQMSFRFDPTFPQNHASVGWGLIAQYHDGENDNYSPSVAWYVDQRNGYVSLTVTRQSAPGVYISQNSVYDAPLGTAWHNYKLRIVWSRSDTTGSIQLWKDKVRQNFLDGTNEINTRTLHPTSDMVYYREGYYRNKAITNVTGIVYHAGYRCATAETGLL